MGRSRAKPCAECQRLRARVATLEAQVQTLAATVARLQEQLAAARKDSATSSKPPSSDLVKPPPPPPPDGQATRRPGGQPGHPRHERPLLPPECLTGVPREYRLESCPACGHDLLPADVPPRVVQQVELLQLPVGVEEHRSVPGWCPHCQRVQWAPLPAAVARGGLIGPRLTALIAYLKGACHASYSVIRKFLRDVLHVSVSRGQLVKIIGKVSQALDTPYQELLRRLPGESRLNVDETGHKDCGAPWWTWCFRASLYTLFKVEPTRSADVLLEVLGDEFNGVLGCDYFSAYRRYMRVCDAVVQFCLAHLIRDIRFLTTLPDARERAYGERLCVAVRALFAVIHGREQWSERAFRSRLRAARDTVLEEAARDVPPGKHSQNLAKRLAVHGQAYFEFVTTPGVEPTNNLAEQAIRFVVLDRHVTQGTRGEAGRSWCERIWTVIATCCQHGRSVFDYLEQAVVAWFGGTAVPSIVAGAKE
jgi:transposase